MNALVLLLCCLFGEGKATPQPQGPNVLTEEEAKEKGYIAVPGRMWLEYKKQGGVIQRDYTSTWIDPKTGTYAGTNNPYRWDDLFKHVDLIRRAIPADANMTKEVQLLNRVRFQEELQERWEENYVQIKYLLKDFFPKGTLISDQDGYVEVDGQVIVIDNARPRLYRDLRPPAPVEINEAPAPEELPGPEPLDESEPIDVEPVDDGGAW